jgi:hypothetical protein
MGLYKNYFIVTIAIYYFMIENCYFMCYYVNIYLKMLHLLVFDYEVL